MTPQQFPPLIPVTLTRKGTPALWESGGGMTNTGDSQVVCGSEGQRLVPIYVRKSGSLACAEHALFPHYPNMVVVRASHHRGDFTVQVGRVTACDEAMAIVEAIATFSEGQWDTQDGKCPAQFVEAVLAAKIKAACWHCREMHYGLQ